MNPSGRPSLQPLLRPHSIAVVGASPRAGAFGHFVLRQLLDSGFTGEIHPVNPGYAEIEELPCFPSIGDFAGPVDCAVICLADARLETALSEAIASGARSAVIFGLAHGVASDGATPLVDRLAQIARGAGIALCGGNGMGFFNLVDPVLISGFPLGRPPVSGHVGLVTHSGSIFSAFAKNRRDLRFNYVISSGQELVTTAADYLDFLVEQAETRVVGCFLETIRDPAGFRAAVDRASARDVPVVLLKVGRSSRGGELALAHSGALAGDDLVHDALCRFHNVVRVRTPDEMLDTLEIFAAGRRPTSPFLAMGCDSGGERALLVDLAADLDVPFAEISTGTRQSLSAALDAGLAPVNPVDLWGTGHDFERVYETCLDALAQDDATGAIAFAVDLTQASRLTPAYTDIANRVATRTEKPFAVLCNVASAVDESAMAALRGAGIPVLMGSLTGLSALGHLLRFQAARDHQRDAPPVATVATSPLLEQWQMKLRAAVEPLTELESQALFALADFRFPPSQPVATVDQLRAGADVIGFPAVLKTAMTGVTHKTEAGGVVLGIETLDRLLSEYAAMAQRCGPEVLLQRQIDTTDGVEFLIGMSHDPQFGPVLTIGLGGILAEIIRDVVCLLPPVSPDSAFRALHSLAGASVLDGVRGRPPVDAGALAAAIHRFSLLATRIAGEVDAIEINPLLLLADELIALDALVVPRQHTTDLKPVDPS